MGFVALVNVCFFIFMLQNQIQTFHYDGSPVTFQNGDSVMVNATEMAKVFNKRPVDWLQNKQTEEYLNELAKVRKSTLADLVQVTRGGDNPGTFMHEDVALEFARWLSPAFAIWCNDRIKELLTQGVSTINDDDATIAHAMEILNKRLEQAKAEKLMLEEKAAAQETVIRSQAPKVEYHDKVLSSTSTYTVTQIAKEFGFGAETLNRKLHEAGVQYKQNGQWLLYAKYQDKGYTRTITREYTGASGKTHTSQQTVWTEPGRKFIHSLFD